MWHRIKHSLFVIAIIVGIGAGAYLIKLFYEVESEVSKITNYQFALASQIVDRKDRLIATALPILEYMKTLDSMQLLMRYRHV